MNPTGTLPNSKLFVFFFIAGAVLSRFVACQLQRNDPKEVFQYFASGEISRRHYEINGKKEGLMIDYYPDGKIRSERMFKNDLQTGRTVFYYPAGQIKETQFFDEKGLKQGGDSTFYQNGKLQMVVHFEAGKKHGYLRRWSEEGEMAYEARFENDSLVEVKRGLLEKGRATTQ